LLFLFTSPSPPRTWAAGYHFLPRKSLLILSLLICISKAPSSSKAPVFSQYSLSIPSGLPEDSRRRPAGKPETELGLSWAFVVLIKSLYIG